MQKSIEVVFPDLYEVRGAGIHNVNGIYLYEGICNNRPYYCNADKSAALWYFHTAIFPSSYWCGWYISKSVSRNENFLISFIQNRLTLLALVVMRITILVTLTGSFHLHQIG
jgi:hypothetical protein